MPALQKHAIFTLIIAASAVVIFFSLLPFLGFVRANAAFAVLSLWALSGIFYRKRSKGGETEPVYDERDRQIQHRANTVTFCVLWLIFVGVTMNMWRQYGDAGKFPAAFLPVAVMLGTAMLLATWSIAILWQYHRQG